MFPNRIERNFVIQVYCEACGEVHAINFRNQTEFENAVCNQTGAVVLCSKSANKVYKEFQQDIMKYAIAV